ncbi:MAG: GntR family transcriptional regulator [Spirochaetaceae bacterium]
MKSDGEDTLPKYYLIANAVVERIKAGELEPGMKVPSENEIIREYGVSNTTARKALQEIELAGWAKRVKGKGTFVLRKDVIRSADRIVSFTRNMLDAGYTPSSRVIDARVVDGYTATINGRSYTVSGPVYRLQRLRFADDIPMLFETRYISGQFCPGILDQDLTQSLYAIYENVYRVELTEEVIQMSCAVISSAQDRELFDLEEGVRAFLIEGATFCGKGIPLEMERSVYRGDKYHFAITATK